MEHKNIERFNEVISIIKDSNLIKEMTPKNLCDTIEKLGPTYIKIGQILSTRVDVLPVEYCDELSRLRSNVETMNFDLVKDILNKNYGNIDLLFSYVEEFPIGSASIAQVHRARLKSGEDVVLKIKRPNIEEIFEEDFAILKRVVDIFHLNKFIKVIDLDDVISEINNTCIEEANFLIEVNHLKQFKNNNYDYPFIDCPLIYEKYSTRDVIVMEYIDGVKINNTSLLKEEGYNLELISDILSENYIKQALDDGFFHADPHSDNIIVDKDKIVYIDLGMMGKLSDRNRVLLKRCIHAIVFEDYREVSNILISMCRKTNEIDKKILEDNVKSILEEYQSLGLESISISCFIKDMFNMLRSNNLVLDKDITLLVRGIGIIEGVLLLLNPNINLIEVLSKSEKDNIINSLTDTNKIKNIGKKVVKSTSDMLELPKEVNTLLKNVNNGDVSVKVELSDSVKHIDKIENLVHEVILGFIDGCLIISAVLIDGNIRNFFIVLIVFISIWLIIKMIKDFIHRGY